MLRYLIVLVYSSFSAFRFIKYIITQSINFYLSYAIPTHNYEKIMLFRWADIHLCNMTHLFLCLGFLVCSWITPFQPLLCPRGRVGSLSERGMAFLTPNGIWNRLFLCLCARCWTRGSIVGTCSRPGAPLSPSILCTPRQIWPTPWCPDLYHKAWEGICIWPTPFQLDSKHSEVQSDFFSSNSSNEELKHFPS